LTTHDSWRSAVTAMLTSASTSPATKEQVALAGMVGLTLHGDEPRTVVAELLEDHLAPAIHGRHALPASEHQCSLLDDLCGDRGGPDRSSLTRRSASAWIRHYLTMSRLGALRELKLERGDVVDDLDRFVDGEGEVHEMRSRHTVSSIGDDGLVYFKGGNGRCSTPTRLRRVTDW
jgi:hypothetical protein